MHDFCLKKVAGDLRTLNDALARFRAIGVDPAEFACLKAIALFKSGKLRVEEEEMGRCDLCWESKI